MLHDIKSINAGIRRKNMQKTSGITIPHIYLFVHTKIYRLHIHLPITPTAVEDERFTANTTIPSRRYKGTYLPKNSSLKPRNAPLQALQPRLLINRNGHLTSLRSQGKLQLIYPQHYYQLFRRLCM